MNDEKTIMLTPEELEQIKKNSEEQEGSADSDADSDDKDSD